MKALGTFGLVLQKDEDIIHRFKMVKIEEHNDFCIVRFSESLKISFVG